MNNKQINRLNLRFFLEWLPYLALVIIPVVVTINFALPYVFMIATSVASIALLSQKEIPLIFFLKFLILAVLAVAHLGDGATVTNIIAVSTGDIFLISCFNLMRNVPRDIAVMRMFKFLWILLLIGFVYSTVMSGPLGLANPLSDLLSGDRFRVLNNERSGHSIAIDVGTITLAIALSGYLRCRFLIKLILVLSSTAVLILANSITAFSLFGAVLCSVTIERLIPGNSRTFRAARLLIHSSAIISLVILASGTDISNDALRIVRTNILMQDDSNYRGDYTSGRAMLNEILIERSLEVPLLGAGQNDSALQYGVLLWTGGQYGALSESTFRLAVKYGYPYMIVTCLIFLMPLMSLVSNDLSLRAIFVPLAYASIIIGANGSAYEVPHSPAYIIYGFIAVLCLAWIRSPKTTAPISSKIYVVHHKNRRVKIMQSNPSYHVLSGESL